MPRLRQVPRSEAHESAKIIYQMMFGDRDPIESPGTPTGSPGNWWTVFAQLPDCFDHCLQGFAFYRSRKRKLSPKLRELGQTRAGFARSSRFVFSRHCKSCRDVGLTEEQIEAIPAWSVPAIQRVLSPRMRCHRIRRSCMTLSMACPMWSAPVTFGSGIMMT